MGLLGGEVGQEKCTKSLIHLSETGNEPVKAKDDTPAEARDDTKAEAKDDTPVEEVEDKSIEAKSTKLTDETREKLAETFDKMFQNLEKKNQQKRLRMK